MEVTEQLKIISRAWGRNQEGYCFFPWIDGSAKDKAERIRGYREGPAFLWPQDKPKILAHMEAHIDDDLYWCPNLFEKDSRSEIEAMDEHCLWADLDRIDPREIEDYPPTVAWETSPDSYQALWILSAGDIQGASWPGRENQALTYHLEADPSGWDSTQLLRIPGWTNHKPDYRKRYGEAPRGKLLWKNRRLYLPDDFTELPEVPGGQVISDFIEESLDHIDKHEVWGRVRLKVTKRCRELVAAREAFGDRSDALWEMERELADAGCSIAEIIKIVQPTVWNKFSGRADELRRLSTEASKAVSERPDVVTEQLELEATRPEPTLLFELLRGLPTPKWLVKDVLTQGAVGFIAGQPKSFKSWMGFDLALSVASGQPFLGEFPVLDPGDVLYIQEEDSGVTLKQRLGKIWPGKVADRMVVNSGQDDEAGLQVDWLPADENVSVPPIWAYVMQNLVVSDPSWQAWLDDQLASRDYKLLVIDPFMMVAGDVEENRAQEMTTKIFRPLKELARKHDTAIQLVHHMRKGNDDNIRGGQMMLGSVANHAWAEDSMYVKRGRMGDIIVEQESKFAPVPGFKINGLKNKRWTPEVQVFREDMPDAEVIDMESGQVRRAREPKARPTSALKKIIDGMTEDATYTSSELGKLAGITTSGAAKQLERMNNKGQVSKWGRGKWRIHAES